MKRIRGRRGGRGRPSGRRGGVSSVRVGAADPWLTKNAGLVAVTELVDRLGVVAALDAAVGPIKARDRGFSGGELLVGIMAAQLAGEDFLVGLDRQRADAAGQVLTPVPGLASTTAAGLARRTSPEQWAAVERGVAAATGTMMRMLGARTTQTHRRGHRPEDPASRRRSRAKPTQATIPHTATSDPPDCLSSSPVTATQRSVPIPPTRLIQ